MTRGLTRHEYERQAVRAISGKTVRSAVFRDDALPGHWLLTFTDGTEIAFTGMVEMYRLPAPEWEARPVFKKPVAGGGQ